MVKKMTQQFKRGYSIKNLFKGSFRTGAGENKSSLRFFFKNLFIILITVGWKTIVDSIPICRILLRIRRDICKSIFIGYDFQFYAIELNAPNFVGRIWVNAERELVFVEIYRSK